MVPLILSLSKESPSTGQGQDRANPVVRRSRAGGNLDRNRPPLTLVHHQPVVPARREPRPEPATAHPEPVEGPTHSALNQ